MRAETDTIPQASQSDVDATTEGHVKTLGQVQRAHDTLLPPSSRLQALLIHFRRQVSIARQSLSQDSSSLTLPQPQRSR